jgi:uncharacterized protein YcaQ
MHYRGMLRIAKREGGIRLYAARAQHDAPTDIEAAIDALVDVVVRKYAPLPERGFRHLISRLVFGVPQWADRRRDALARAKAQYASALVDGTRWYWPADENPRAVKHRVAEAARFLAPFDPVVWDRDRFEQFWGWAYRFEAYTPAPKRVRGYYALPLLWRDQVIGWGNLSIKGGDLATDVGYVTGSAPRDAGFTQALDEELERMRVFLTPR